MPNSAPLRRTILSHVGILKRCSCLCLVFTLIAACSSVPVDSTIRMSAEAVPNIDAARELRASDADLEDALTKDYFAVLSDCSQALSKFESEGRTRSRLAQYLAFGGLLAGSVGVPALTAASSVGNSAWIAGLGGFAGATNTAQHWIQQSGLSYVESLRTREQIRSEFKTAIEDFLASNDIDRRRASLLRAKAACVLYAVSIPNVKLVQGEAQGNSPGAPPGGADGQEAVEKEEPEETNPEEPAETNPEEPAETNSEEPQAEPSPVENPEEGPP